MASSPKIHIGFGFRFGNNERFGELNRRNKFTKIKLFHMFIECYIDCTSHAICHSQFINELHHKFGIKSQLVDFSNISNEFQQLAGDLDFPSKLTWGKLNAWRMLEFWSRCRWILSRFLVKCPPDCSNFLHNITEMWLRMGRLWRKAQRLHTIYVHAR